MAPAWVLLDNSVDLHLDGEDDGSAAATVEAVASSEAISPFQPQSAITVALLASMKPDAVLLDPPEIATFRLLGTKIHRKHDVAYTSFVACADKSLLVIYGGRYTSPGSSPRGCYVVFDAAASPPLLSTVPPLPQALYIISIGAGTIVLRRQPPSSAYLLAELTTKSCRNLPDGEIYLWRSDEPTPRWTRKEVRLPPEMGFQPGKHLFVIDTSFSGPGTDTLCWVDLLNGIVVCTNPEDDDPVFSFIPFPDDCTAVGMSDDHLYRPRVEEFRAVACIGGAIKLAAMVGPLEGWSPDRPGPAGLTTWTLSPDLRKWQLDGTFPIKGLWATDEYRALNVPPQMPICPVLGLTAREDTVVYAVVNDLTARDILQGSVRVRTDFDFKCQYVIGIDIRSNKIISTSSPLQKSMLQLKLSLRATDFCAYLQGGKDHRQREVEACDDVEGKRQKVH